MRQENWRPPHAKFIGLRERDGIGERQSGDDFPLPRNIPEGKQYGIAAEKDPLTSSASVEEIARACEAAGFQTEICRMREPGVTLDPSEYEDEHEFENAVRNRDLHVNYVFYWMA